MEQRTPGVKGPRGASCLRLHVALQFTWHPVPPCSCRSALLQVVHLRALDVRS